MKLQNLVVVLLFMTSLNVFAQDSSTSTPALRMKGKLGIYLNANSDFTPNNFIGGNGGIKYFILPMLAVRGGLSINNSSFGLRHPRFMEEFGNEPDDTMEMRRRHRWMTSSTFGANLYGMYYPLSAGNFSFYTGAGVIYDFYTTRAHITLPDGTTIQNSREQRFGFGGLLGTEYKILAKLSLSFEYNPTFLLESTHKERDNEENRTIPEVRGLRDIDAKNFNLGVVYYFN